MEAALEAGKIRAIGVSNFGPDGLVDIARFVDVAPPVNQIQTHPYDQQQAAHEIMA
jgi:diketogulonate reductase-like aldo/keto reductase